MTPNPNTSLILIVDDDPFIRAMLRRYLEKELYNVIEACHGEEALTICRRLRPDIVLLDALMPVMDGFTCCQQLQQMPMGDRIPVLMITGLEDEVSVDEAFAAGATDYVTKPIHWAVLRQRVRRLLQQSQLHRQLETANIELQRLVVIDGLTQVANRRHFDQYLEQEWHRLARQQSMMALILTDIDWFKPYNDTYGHQAGDSCLQQIAATLKQALFRSADLLARYGGEEFAIIMPDTQVPGALKVVERIRAAVADLKLSHPTSQASPYVTLSYGIACFIPQPHTSPSILINAADKALYQAKDAGRDCARLNALYAVDGSIEPELISVPLTISGTSINLSYIDGPLNDQLFFLDTAQAPQHS